jgi:hypothetical protein
MDESNAAPRLLSRPGEGIYNDMAGALEGNSPFQAAWLSDDVRDQHLARIRQRADADQVPRPGPMVFEGNAPAAVQENAAFQRAMQTFPTAVPTAPRIWVGAPNSIKDSTQVVFESHAGSNLLVVGQSGEAEVEIACLALVALAAQYPVGALRLILFEPSLPGTPEREFFDQIVQALPHPVLRPGRSGLAQTLNELALEINQRTGDETASENVAIFLVIAGLQTFKQLRPEDEFSLSTAEPGASGNAPANLSTIIREGPSHRCHVIVTVDTYGNVARFLGRKALSEFQSRILFQMSPNDSASLMDSPEASKLGLYRALLHDEREGSMEKFRPYALTGTNWPVDVARAFGARGKR